MTNSVKVLAIAAGEIGYSRWNDNLRGTKYARETQPVLWPRDPWLLANGIAFCDIFVTWVFWKAGALDVLPGRQSFNTDYRASAGRNAGALVTRAHARPGDVLVFDWNRATQATNHVGILEKVTASGNPQSIEGNTSPGSAGSQGNGGGVYRRVRRWDQVRYIIRPDWAKLAPAIPSGGASAPAAKPAAKPASKPSTSKAPAFPLPRKEGAMYYYGPPSGPKTSVSGRGRNTGAPGDVVMQAGRWYSKGLKMWQQRMLDRGWSGIGKADGRFGPATEKVVRQFQKSKGLGVDGKIGPGTWAAAWTEPVT